jgi:hypothetical protein
MEKKMNDELINKIAIGGLFYGGVVLAGIVAFQFDNFVVWLGFATAVVYFAKLIGLNSSAGSQDDDSEDFKTSDVTSTKFDIQDPYYGKIIGESGLDDCGKTFMDQDH